VKIGDDIRMEVEDFVPPLSPDGPPVQLTNVFHPAASTLTVAPAKTAEIKGFGIEFGRAGESGFSAPFAWAG
jgi:hypothetical protein